MNVRTNRPIQFDITIRHRRVSTGEVLYTNLKYGFATEPSWLKVKVVANALEQSVRHSLAGVEFLDYQAERID